MSEKVKHWYIDNAGRVRDVATSLPGPTGYQYVLASDFDAEVKARVEAERREKTTDDAWRNAVNDALGRSRALGWHDAALAIEDLKAERDDCVSMGAVIDGIENELRDNDETGVWNIAVQNCLSAVHALPSAGATGPVGDEFEEALDRYLRAEHDFSNQCALDGMDNGGPLKTKASSLRQHLLTLYRTRQGCVPLRGLDEIAEALYNADPCGRIPAWANCEPEAREDYTNMARTVLSKGVKLPGRETLAMEIQSSWSSEYIHGDRCSGAAYTAADAVLALLAAGKSA